MKTATLVLFMTGWLFSLVHGQNASPQPPVLGVSEFLALEVPKYKVERLTLEATVAKLEEMAKLQTGQGVPSIKVVRYGQTVSTEANPWEERELLTLEVERDSVANILNYIGELTGFVRYADKWQLGLFQVPQLPERSSTASTAPSGSMSIAQFMAFKVPEFQCVNASSAEAVSKLREVVSKASGKRSPVIGVVDYDTDAKRERPPVRPEDIPRVTLDLKDTAAGELLRYIAELSCRSTRFTDSCIGLRDILGLYHPKAVREFRLKEITAVWGKPQKPIAGWLQDILPVPLADVVGVNESTGQVFITCPPEYMRSVLQPPKSEKRK